MSAAAALPAQVSQGRAIDTTRPCSARVWDYWVGGKDHYLVDRAAGDKVIAIFPGIVEAARHDRDFLSRAVQYMAAREGIGQFLHIGAGLPTLNNNSHQTAQRVIPKARVVYVDKDPLAAVFGCALLISSPEGKSVFIEADVSDPGHVLTQAARTLDFTRPVGLLLGVLDHIVDDEEMRAIVQALVGHLSVGSVVAVSWLSAELDGDLVRLAMRAFKTLDGPDIVVRDRHTLQSLLEGLGLVLVPPGVVSCSLWRPVGTEVGEPQPVAQVCGLARKVRR